MASAVCMIQIDERPATTPAAYPPSDPASVWFSAFEDALASRDIDRVSGLFAATSFWRDLIAFSWNLTTVENPSGVADLMTATLAGTDPHGFRLTEQPDTADGVTTAWFEFETAVGRGRGLVRLIDEDGP